MGELHAVLTGDIIGSTKKAAPPSDQIHAALRAAASDIAVAQPKTLVGELDIFRGDSWQLLLSDPGAFLAVALIVRANLKFRVGVDTRIAVGVGTVDHIDQDRISMSSGPAFTTSGRRLDAMTKPPFLTINSANGTAARDVIMLASALSAACDAIVQDWTARQAEIARLVFISPDATYGELAEQLEPPVALQTIAKAYTSASLGALLLAIEAVEGVSWNSHGLNHPKKDEK